MSLKPHHDDEEASTKLDKHKRKYARRLGFTKFVQSKEVETGKKWCCCSASFNCQRDMHKHVATEHAKEIDESSCRYLQHGCPDARWSVFSKIAKHTSDEDAGREDISEDVKEEMRLPAEFDEKDEYPWLVPEHKSAESNKGQVVLFYKYRIIHNTQHVRAWQQELCARLSLTGKIRVAEEGLNATVGGSMDATDLYISCVLAHPLFCDMTKEDFKTSPGGADAFPNGLKVGIHQEAVPMAIPPAKCSFQQAGEHLSPEQFHAAVEQYKDGQLKDKAVFIDCRNFYESKIGKFDGAVAPDIRKFSYWPEYVDQNEDLFRDKQVYMYCTGGIRCERGSAYIKDRGLTDKVYQLKGGIHKYIEQFPDGYFRGKLFVFDDRYTIASNEDVISECVYCHCSWDKYKPCSSQHCHQLVLSCEECCKKGWTTCCHRCRQNADSNSLTEECECTHNRPRIPKETLKS